MSELSDDPRSIAESISADARHLQDIEDQKAALPADDPGIPPLAAEAEKVAALAAAKAAAERELVEEAGET